MPQALENSVIRILNTSGTTVGTGFFAGDGLAVTCAHVVMAALGIKEGVDSDARGQKVQVRLRGANHIYFATVSSKGWSPVSMGDVAFLCFDENLEGVPPLRMAGSRCSNGSRYSAFGFPDGAESWDCNVIGGPVEEQNGYTRLQLVGNQMRQGFSGGPILDNQLDRVVGMVTWGRDGPHERIALAVTVDTIAALWPELEIDDPETIRAEHQPVETEKTNPEVPPQDTAHEIGPYPDRARVLHPHNQSPIRKSGPIVLALGIYSLLVYTLAATASVGMFIPKPILRKVLQSESPNISLIVFCAGVIAFIWLLIWFGLDIKLPGGIILPAALKKKIHQVSTLYPAGLFAAALLVFFLITNQCQTPAVTFSIKGKGEIQPNAVIIGAPNERLIFLVSPVEEAIIGCNWSSAGSGIAIISQHTGCSSSVWLASEPGSAILNVAVNEGMCANRDNYAFSLLIRNP